MGERSKPGRVVTEEENVLFVAFRLSQLPAYKTAKRTEKVPRSASKKGKPENME